MLTESAVYDSTSELNVAADTLAAVATRALASAEATRGYGRTRATIADAQPMAHAAAVWKGKYLQRWH